MLHVKKIILLILVYLLFYKPELFFIPSSLNLLFGTIGFILSIFVPKDKNVIFNRSGLSANKIFKYAIPFVVIAFFSCIINFSFDVYYVKYFFSLILGFYFSYLVVFLFYKVYKIISPRILIEYILSAHIIYIVLSLMMFFNPSINAFLMSLLKLGSGAESAYEITEGIRLLCFGASFFTSGIINGLVLILLSIYISIYKHSNLKLLILYLLFILIIIVGMMMARTTLIGALFAIGILLYYLLQSGIKLLKIVFLLFFICFLIAFIASKLSPIIAEQIELLLQFAFEMFIKYESSGALSTNSSDRMIEMYETLPDNLKTWIIGDAIWIGSDGAYYMNTDVGYLRFIFYFGVIGCATMILFIYKIPRFYLQDYSYSPATHPKS